MWRNRSILQVLVLVVLLFPLQTQGTTKFAGPIAATGGVARGNAPIFSCTCSCNGGDKNCSGHCQIFVSCDSAAECFLCVSDCCHDQQLQ